jgi:uncharacterized membrane protein
MGKRNASTVICSICGQPRRAGEVLPGEVVREPVASEVRAAHPQWDGAQPVCFLCLNRYRAEHVRRLLEEEKGELSALEEEVIQSLAEQELVSENINQEFERELSLAERLSDKLAGFGGSWTFISLFALAMLGWITLNSVALMARPFDPFPFILLNLVLSCLAAIQAPVIMMSQNRQEAKDRLRSEHDYRVNLKAELEIRLLHAKMDQLLTHEWQRLLEIQQMQIDVMNELAERKLSGGRSPTPPAP